jgi:antitoxin (DNA-binding transcriptional repressor) of toxin-antitoxin stability system
MQFSIRELKANPARAIELARKGELVEITSHRKVVAELIRPAKKPKQNELTDEQALNRLITSGLAQAAEKPLKLGRPIKLARPSNEQSMSELVMAMRGRR